MVPTGALLHSFGFSPLQADIDAGRCLAVADSAWNLVTRIFTDYFSNVSKNVANETYLGKKGRTQSIGDGLASLTVEHLFPRLLRLTTHSTVYAHHQSEVKASASNPLTTLLMKYSSNIFSRLQTDHILFPAAVPPSNFPQHRAQKQDIMYASTKI